MTIEGADYSWSRPSVQLMKNAGLKFVVRYLDASGKGIDKAEADALRAAKLNICLVFEGGANHAASGRAAGVADMQTAVRLAKALGVPAGVCIYLAVDFDVTSQMAAVEAYFDGAHSVRDIYRVGVYGEADVIDAVVGNGHADLGWDTYAWSGGRLSTYAALFQYQNGVNAYGGQIDRDRAVKDDYGAWLAQGNSGSTQTTDSDDLVAWMADNKATVQAMLDSLHHDMTATLEARLSDHNAALLAKVNASLQNVYQWLSRAEFDGKVSSDHLPMSIKGSRDDILTELRALAADVQAALK